MTTITGIVNNGDGTVTYQISGSSGFSATVGIWAKIPGGSFVLVATRLGDGSITFALTAGLYETYATDGTTTSPTTMIIATGTGTGLIRSIDCWLYAVREYLIGYLGAATGLANVGRKTIEITPEGQPLPKAGEWFIGIDEDSIAAEGIQHLREIYTLQVVITRRISVTPQDRRFGIYLAQNVGLTAIERAVVRLLNKNWLIRDAANTVGGLPSSNTGDAFQLPLQYLGRPKTVTKDGSWGHAEPDAASFMVRSLRFSGGLRVQDFDVMH